LNCHLRAKELICGDSYGQQLLSIREFGIPALEDMQRLALHPDSNAIDKKGETNML